MKTSFAVLVAAGLAVAASGCSKPEEAAPPAAPPAATPPADTPPADATPAEPAADAAPPA